VDLRPGAVIAGRYRVDRKVGSGGMGEVWSGDHLAIGSRVALKTMLPAAAVNHEVVARFKREAFLLGKIRSDYVARVVDFVADDNFGLVLVMEFIEGVSLARILTERLLTIEETVEVGCDLASALCDLHRAHIVHRDLKPGNVILSPLADGRRRAVVVDFGVSRLMSAGAEDEETITGITRADMAVGTIEYMSPEQILNSRSVTLASDIYAVGAILFRAVAGHHVFGDVHGESELAQYKLTQEAPPLPIPIHDRVGAGLRDAVARTLRRRPSERFTTAEQMVEAFAPLRDLVRLAALDLDSTTQDAKSNPAHEPTGRKARPNVAVAAIPASYLVPAAEVSMHSPPSSGPRPPFASSSGEQRISFPYPEIPMERRGGIPLYAVALAIGGALACGAIASALLLPHAPPRDDGDAGDALAMASASPSAEASATPAATVEPAPSSTADAPSANPSSSAAPAASAPGAVGDGGAPFGAPNASGAAAASARPWGGASAGAFGDKPAAPPTNRPFQPKPQAPPLNLDAPPAPVDPKF
jgi:eukaryotic-like serine/threonine-protein kinase